MPRRLEVLRDEVGRLERMERDGQSKFRELADERDALLQRTQALEEELVMQQAEALNDAAMQNASSVTATES